MKTDSSKLYWRSRAFAAILTCTLLSQKAAAQRVSMDSLRLNDSTSVYRFVLSDGSKVVGQIGMISADSIRVRSSTSSTTIARTSVREVRVYPASAVRNGELWLENPHATRLFFSPTAIPLRKGENYFSDFWVFLLSGAHGVTDRFTLGVGGTIIPGIDLTQNVIYLLPKYTVVNASQVKLAVGGLLASVPYSEKTRKSMGLLYGVGTLGSRENNLTLGTGFGYIGNRFTSTPVITLGGQARVSKHIALLTENWFDTSGSDLTGFATYGLRALSEEFAVDFGFGLPIDPGGSSMKFPGVPLLGFSVRY